MTAKRDKSAPPRLLVDVRTAADMLSIGEGLFRREILPGLVVVHVGAEVRVAVAELEAWVRAQRERAAAALAPAPRHAPRSPSGGAVDMSAGALRRAVAKRRAK